MRLRKIVSRPAGPAGKAKKKPREQLRLTRL
jgi:hypothetical protein